MENSLYAKPETMDTTGPQKEAPDYSRATDAVLIQRALQKDVRAYEVLVQRHYQNAYRAALLLTRNPDAALDISQEAFVRVHRHLRSFNREKSLGAWLYRIVRNLSLNYLKRYRQRWRVFSDEYPDRPPPIHDTGVSPLTRLIDEETRHRLWNALQKLAPHEREIIILKDFNDFSYQEIAEAIGIPSGTVMSRLFYARKKLARLLGGHHETD